MLLRYLKKYFDYFFKKKITGFYVACHAHVHHFEKIYKYMPKNRFKILIFKHKQYKNFSNEISQIFDKKNIVYQILKENEKCSLKFENFVQMAPSYKHKDIAKFNVRYMLNAYERHLDIEKDCDIFLCQGPRNEVVINELVQNKNIKVVRGGYARLQEIRPKNWTLPKENEINITYMPTHGVGSTIGFYIQEIINLSKVFKILVKPHPDSFTSSKNEANAISIFKKNKINIKYESHENENWLLNTDLFIGDFGGSTILGLYFNVPTILLDPPNMSDQKKLLFKNMNLKTLPMEIYIRNYLTNIKYSKRKKLNKTFILKIIENYKQDDFKALKSEFFYDTNIKAGKSFAQALLK